MYVLFNWVISTILLAILLYITMSILITKYACHKKEISIKFNCSVLPHINSINIINSINREVSSLSIRLISTEYNRHQRNKFSITVRFIVFDKEDIKSMISAVKSILLDYYGYVELLSIERVK